MSETFSEFMARLSKESLYAWRSRALAAKVKVARLAAENEKLRAEVQKLDSECTDLATDLNTQRQDNASLAEPWKVVNPLRAENERLRAALNLIRKTYPADNARLIHNAHQIIAIATTALQDKSDVPPEGNRLNDSPDWEDLRGRAPDATGDLSSEAFIRKLRDSW